MFITSKDFLKIHTKMINVFGHINIYSFWNAEESIQKPKHKNRLRENISGHTENMDYDETDFVQ